MMSASFKTDSNDQQSSESNLKPSVLSTLALAQLSAPVSAEGKICKLQHLEIQKMLKEHNYAG